MFKVVLLIYEDLWLSMDDALPMEADRPSLRVDDGPLMVCGPRGQPDLPIPQWEMFILFIII